MYTNIDIQTISKVCRFSKQKFTIHIFYLHKRYCDKKSYTANDIPLTK